MLIMRVILHLDISDFQRSARCVVCTGTEGKNEPCTCAPDLSGVGRPAGHTLMFVVPMCLYQASAGSLCDLQTARQPGALPVAGGRILVQPWPWIYRGLSTCGGTQLLCLMEPCGRNLILQTRETSLAT